MKASTRKYKKSLRMISSNIGQMKLIEAGVYPMKSNDKYLYVIDKNNNIVGSKVLTIKETTFQNKFVLRYSL